MKNNYLEVITTESNTVPREGVIAINDSIKEFPYLEVYENGKWRPIDNYRTLLRAARFEDLYTTLYERDWMIGGRLFTKGLSDLYLTTSNYDKQIPVISSSDPMVGLVSKKNDAESRDKFEDLYIQLMKVQSMNDIKEIDLGSDYYKYLVSTRNLIDQSSTVDLYSYTENSTDYGNILNLVELLQKKDKIRYMEGGYTIRLEIMYVKSENRMSGTFIFDPFNIDNEGNMTFNNFQTVINDDVTVEVKKGCIRLFPETTDITECIIYHCYMIYEKLL